MKRPSSPGETTPEPTPDRAGASAALPSRTGSPHDYKYASTRRLGGEHVINQDELLKVILSHGSAEREVTDLFTFWRPVVAGSRKSVVLQLTNKQQDLMYALAGCIDVIFLISRVKPEVRRAVEQVYGIDKTNFAIWYKNRGRNPSKFCYPDLQTLKRLRKPGSELEDEEEDLRPTSRVPTLRLDKVPPAKPGLHGMGKVAPTAVDSRRSSDDSQLRSKQPASPEGTVAARTLLDPVGPMSLGQNGLEGGMSTLQAQGPGGMLRIQPSQLPGGLVALSAGAPQVQQQQQQSGSKTLALTAVAKQQVLSLSQASNHQQLDQQRGLGLQLQELQGLQQQQLMLAQCGNPSALSTQVLFPSASGITVLPSGQVQLQQQQQQMHVQLQRSVPATMQLPFDLPPGYQLVAVPPGFPTQQLLQLHSSHGAAGQAAQQTTRSHVQLQQLLQAQPGITLQVVKPERQPLDEQAVQQHQQQPVAAKGFLATEGVLPAALVQVPRTPRMLPHEVTASSGGTAGKGAAEGSADHGVDQPTPGVAAVPVKHEPGAEALRGDAEAAANEPVVAAATATTAGDREGSSGAAASSAKLAAPQASQGGVPVQRVLQLGPRTYLTQAKDPAGLGSMQTAVAGTGQVTHTLGTQGPELLGSMAQPAMTLSSDPAGQLAGQGQEPRHIVDVGGGMQLLLHPSMGAQDVRMMGHAQQSMMAPMQTMMINGQQVLVSNPGLMQGSSVPQQQATLAARPTVLGGAGGQMLLLVQQGPNGMQLLQQLPVQQVSMQQQQQPQQLQQVSMQQQQQQHTMQVQVARVQQVMQGQGQQQLCYQLPSPLLGQCCVVQSMPQGPSWAQLGSHSFNT